MDKFVERLKGVFSEKNNLLAFAVAFLVIAPLLAVSSGFFLLASLEFNPVAEPANIAVISTIALLMSANAAVFFHNYSKWKTAGKNVSFAGFIGGLFVTSCPVCQPIWLVWLGLGSFTGFLADFSVFIGIASIALLLAALYFSLNSKDSCEVEK